MKRIYFIVFSFIAVFAAHTFSACGTCGGCDKIATTETAVLEVNDSLSILSTRIIELNVREIYRTRKVDRNCRTKDLKICASEGLQKDLVTIKCNKDLKLDSGVIIAGKNLMDFAQEAKENNFEDTYTIELKMNDSFESGHYTFILSGTTKEGKSVNDTTWVIWK